MKPLQGKEKMQVLIKVKIVQMIKRKIQKTIQTRKKAHRFLMSMFKMTRHRTIKHLEDRW